MEEDSERDEKSKADWENRFCCNVLNRIRERLKLSRPCCRKSDAKWDAEQVLAM